jgi:type II secretory pathway component PulJ
MTNFTYIKKRKVPHIGMFAGACDSRDSRDCESGYTLVELLITIAVFMMLSFGVMTFYLTSQKTMFKTSMKLKTSGNVRNLTAVLDQDGRNSDAIIMHDDFYGDFRSLSDDDDITATRLSQGESGKMIILVYYGEDPTPADVILPPIESIVFYCVDPSVSADDVYASIYRMEVEATSATEYLLPEQLLPSSLDTTVATEVAVGLADSTTFYRFATNCAIFYSAIQNGNDYLAVNNIQSFTITSR